MITLTQGFQLERLIVLPAENSVIDGKRRIELEPRVMKLLVLLARHQDQVLGRERLLEEIWSDVLVQEDSLTKAISELRRILGDDPRSPQYVRTIRKGGYQLIADIRPLETALIANAVGRPMFLALLLGAILIIVLVIFLPTAERPTNQSVALFTDLNITRLTSFAGQESEPQLSPDGGKFVFVRNHEQIRYDLFVKTLDSPRLLQLTESPFQDRYPVWSPDGSQIAFLRHHEDRSTVMMIPALGGDALPLVSVAYAGMGLDWSRDGKLLYFSSKNNETAGFKITEYRLEDGLQRYLTDPPPSFEGDRSAKVHPVDGRIGFLRHNRQGQVQFLTLGNSGQIQTLHEEQGANLSFSWLPGSNSLLFDRLEGARYGIRRLDLGTGRSEPINGISGWTLFPNVHAHLPRMVFLEVAVRRDVMRVDLATPDSIRPLIASTQLDFDAQYSHDGRQIAFVSSRSGEMQLYLADDSGQLLTQLTQFESASLNTPAWSNDDHQIALQINQQGRNFIVLIDLATTTVKPLIEDQFINVKPAWSGDGQSIYFGSNRSGDWQIWQQRLDRSLPTQLTHHGGRIAKLGTDGKTLLVTRQAQKGLWRFDLQTLEEDKLISDLGHSDLNNWAVHEDAVYYVRREAELAFVYRYLIDERTQERLVQLPNLDNVSINLSPDGRFLLYTAMPPLTSDIMLAEWPN